VFGIRDQHARLCELNVVEQVRHVCQTTSVQEAWKNGQPLTVHGWVYGVGDGLARDLEVSVSAAGNIDEACAHALKRIEAGLSSEK